MIHVCKEENASPEQVFFVFAFLCFWLYRYELSKHKFFVCEGKQLMNILRLFFLKIKKKSCRILQAPIFCRWSFKGVAQGSSDLSRIFEGKVTKLKFLFLLSMLSQTRVYILYILYYRCEWQQKPLQGRKTPKQ